MSSKFSLDQIPESDPNFDPTSVPFVRRIVDGEIPGVLVTQADTSSPEFAPFVENGRSLFTKAGLVMTATSKGAVLFNPDTIKLKDIDAADKSGSLQDLFPTVVEAAAGGAEPSASAVGSPGEEAPREATPFPSLGSMVPPLPAGVQGGITRGRMKAQAAAALPVTRTPSPTGGNLLARIRQPVV